MKTSLKTPALLLAITLTACTAAAQPPADSQLIEQFALSVNWMQKSGEYRALAYQAFNAATAAFDSAKPAKGKRKAAVVDLDETILNNSPYMAWEAATGNNYNTAPDSWYQWTAAASAKAIPGALPFAEHVVSHGGSIYYVSNRKQAKELQSTIANLQALGFPNVSEKTVLLKTDSSSKQARFDAIAANGADIVVYVGDNLNDFGDGAYKKDAAARMAFADQRHSDFGKKYIILPNPIYGDWESGLAKDYWDKPPEQQLQIRKAALEQWHP